MELSSYQNLFGKIHIRKETDCRSGRVESAQRWSLVISAPFLPSYVEWQSLNIYGQIARTLLQYPVLQCPSSYFEMFVEGKTVAFQSALRRRETSPFARDWTGETLLHIAAFANNYAICSLLIQLGANPDQTTFEGATPFHKLLLGHKAGILRLDCFKLLIKAQREVTEEDLDQFYRTYRGPTEAAEIMFAYDTDFNLIPRQRQFRATALHIALRNLSFDHGRWHRMTQMLLRKDFDLHARDRVGHSPLDALFQYCRCPCDSQTAAATWLSLLREETFDIMTYFREEMTLDLRRNHTLCGGCRRIPKGAHLFESPRDPRYEIMIFELDPPKVGLDWHFDLNSPASLVWNEFGHFTSHHHDECSRLECLWPFEFPKWSRVYYEKSDRTGDTWSQYIAFLDRNKLARCRGDRRIERKAQKLARSQRYRGPRRMPGAWIA